jgi:hypothetical protein
VVQIEQQKTKVEQQVDLVHWHMLRGDNLRAGLASRAGTLLSTDALIVAGVTLALGLRNQRADHAVLAISLATLICVAVSAVNASLVLMSVRRWHYDFGKTEAPQPFLYSYTGMHGSYNDFKAKVLSLSQERLLEYALVELWRCGQLHTYRYKKLRRAVRWLLAAIAFLFVTILISAL